MYGSDSMYVSRPRCQTLSQWPYRCGRSTEIKFAHAFRLNFVLPLRCVLNSFAGVELRKFFFFYSADVNRNFLTHFLWDHFIKLPEVSVCGACMRVILAFFSNRAKAVLYKFVNYTHSVSAASSTKSLSAMTGQRMPFQGVWGETRAQSGNTKMRNRLHMSRSLFFFHVGNIISQTSYDKLRPNIFPLRTRLEFGFPRYGSYIFLIVFNFLLAVLWVKQTNTELACRHPDFKYLRALSFNLSCSCPKAVRTWPRSLADRDWLIDCWV